MVIQRIRELNKKVPFEPYSVRLTSGAVYPVPHPDFILVSPKGSWIDIADADDNGHHISALLIEEVTIPSPAQKNGTSGNGS
jgi:hypothetical protein